MSQHRREFRRRGPFVTTLFGYPGQGGWTLRAYRDEAGAAPAGSDDT